MWLKLSHKKQTLSLHLSYNPISLLSTMSPSQESEVSTEGCAAEFFHPATGWCQRPEEQPIGRQNESERAGILLKGLLAKQAQLWSAGAICTSLHLKLRLNGSLAERVQTAVCKQLRLFASKQPVLWVIRVILGVFLQVLFCNKKFSINK